MNRDNITADRSARPFAAAGILVGAVALLGFDLMSPTATARWHKAPSSVVHAVTPANGAAIVIAPAFACSAVILAVLLWLGRQSSDPLRCFAPISCATVRNRSAIPPALRSRTSISYHSGGLYGP